MEILNERHRHIEKIHAAYRQEGVRIRTPLDLHVAARLGRPVLGTVHLRGRAAAGGWSDGQMADKNGGEI